MMYVFILKIELQRQQERDRELQATGSLFKWLQSPKLWQIEARSLDLYQSPTEGAQHSRGVPVLPQVR